VPALSTLPALPELKPLDFNLPKELEAGAPPEARGLCQDQVRLMVIHRINQAVIHTQFHHLPADLWIVELRQPAGHSSEAYYEGRVGQRLELPGGRSALIHIPYRPDQRRDKHLNYSSQGITFGARSVSGLK
jgi:S-adenosylmethionine:tRNA ribosyltransferase-isomerase